MHPRITFHSTRLRRVIMGAVSDAWEDARILALPEPWRGNAQSLLKKDPAALTNAELSGAKGLYDSFAGVPTTDAQYDVFQGAAAVLSNFIHQADPADTKFKGTELIFPVDTGDVPTDIPAIPGLPAPPEPKALPDDKLPPMDPTGKYELASKADAEKTTNLVLGGLAGLVTGLVAGKLFL